MGNYQLMFRIGLNSYTRIESLTGVCYASIEEAVEASRAFQGRFVTVIDWSTAKPVKHIIS